MSSLKEVKNRIQSVQTTRKITSARQMVASAHLHRAQTALANARIYRDELEMLLGELFPPQPAEQGVPAAGARERSFEREFEDTPTPDERAGAAPDQTAVIVMASDGGMCGAFNSRMEKELHAVAADRGAGKTVFCPIGKKMRDAVRSAGYPSAGDFDTLGPRAGWAEACAAFTGLTERFTRIDAVYYEFEHTGSQKIVHRTLFPVVASATENQGMAAGASDEAYIVEPTREEVVAALTPMVACARFYAALCSNRASEHAARMLAMQAATENANDLLDDLQLSYNKLRQQNITSELLDIIGSSFA